MTHTTAPLSMELVKEQFENKEMTFVINYKESELQGKNLLVYISNLELNCEIDFHSCSFDKREELIKEFLNVNCINNINSLRLNAAHIILEFMGVDFSEEILNPAFSKSEIQIFIKNNKETLEKWKTFLQSTMVYNLTSVSAVNEEYKFDQIFETVDDPFYIGRNVVTLLSIPTFMERVYSIPVEQELFYFKQQFEECMFKGESLFYYFCNEANTPFLIYNMLLTGDMSIEELEAIKTLKG